MDINKYSIEKSFLTKNTKRRSGLLIKKVRFIVAHDTGNPGSTARNNVDYYEKTNNQSFASAHIFVDDKEIIECIPALEKAEKAWQVRYELPKDNSLFGDDANDAAIGVELCFGGKINIKEAYARYVWVVALLCKKYKLNPGKNIVGHCDLDPGRKKDPTSGLKLLGKSFGEFSQDVADEIK